MKGIAALQRIKLFNSPTPPGSQKLKKKKKNGAKQQGLPSPPPSPLNLDTRPPLVSTNEELGISPTETCFTTTTNSNNNSGGGGGGDQHQQPSHEEIAIIDEVRGTTGERIQTIKRMYNSAKRRVTPRHKPKFASQDASTPSPNLLLTDDQLITTTFPQPPPPPPPSQPTRPPNRPFRILAIDGGGVRGILPACLLRQLEVEAGRPICEMFDLVAGTSTGAILAAMLALPKHPGSTEPKFSADDGVALYKEKCPKIFQTTMLRRIKTLAGLANAQYSNANKRAVLEEYLGDAKISDLLVDILVPSFDIREGRPYFFKSSKARRDGSCDYKLVDVLDATSCAPTYFPPHRVDGYDAPKQFGYRSFVDGALTANSPALCALAEAYRHYGADPTNTVLVSLGCGASEIGVDHEVARNWGALSWAPFFPNVMLSSSVNTVHYQLAHVVPPKHYFRVQTPIPVERSGIDNAQTDNLNWLADHGAGVAATCRQQLSHLAKLLNDLDDAPLHPFDPAPRPPLDTPTLPRHHPQQQSPTSISPPLSASPSLSPNPSLPVTPTSSSFSVA